MQSSPVTFVVYVLQVIIDTTLKMGLTPEDDFILRVVQLSELLAIRHCVFLMGPTGSGRSECYKVLAKAIQTGTNKPVNTYLEACNRKKVQTQAARCLAMPNPSMYTRMHLAACMHRHVWESKIADTHWVCR